MDSPPVAETLKGLHHTTGARLQAAEARLQGRLGPRFPVSSSWKRRLALPGPRAEPVRLEARTQGRGSESGWEGQTALRGPRGPSSRSSHHLPEAPLVAAEAVTGNSNSVSQEQGQGR